MILGFIPQRVLAAGALSFALLSGCAPSPAEYTDIGVRASSNPYGWSAEADGRYVSNIPKNAKEFDALTGKWLDCSGTFKVEDMEFGYSEDANKEITRLHAEIKGSPQVLYVLMNGVKNRGNFGDWIIARAQNDGFAKDVKIYKDMKNRITGYKTETKPFYAITRPDNLSIILLTDKNDETAFDAVGIAGRTGMWTYTDGLPDNFYRWLANLSDKHKSGVQIEKELENLNKTVGKHYAEFISGLKSTKAYGIVTDKQREAATVLKDLQMKRKVENVEPWMQVGNEYKPFVIFTKGTDENTAYFVSLDEVNLDDFLKDPMGEIAKKPLMKGKIGKR